MAKLQDFLISFFITISFALMDLSSLAQDTTASWSSCMAYYQALDLQCNHALLTVFGYTDAGRPLYCMIINKDGEFNPQAFDRNKIVLLINNNIHPGEPDGVEASMKLCADLCAKEISTPSVLDHAIICIIPMYNVDGAFVRGAYSRANQNGPEEYGFRGNALNLDLNRDFVKCDSKNALAFNSLFTRIKPHLLVDTHVSNGADYQPTLTLITTQSDKLGKAQGEYVRNVLEPMLFQQMEKTKYPMVPYVHTMGRTPESGIEGFLETPRFATGYAALYGTIGLTTETHMLKPFAQRVEATYLFLTELLGAVAKNRTGLLKQYNDGIKERELATKYALHYGLDTTQHAKVLFNGFKALDEPARFGTGQRLRYDRSQKWQAEIPYFNRYVGKDSVDVPAYYVLPAGWRHAKERLDSNHVRYRILDKDSVVWVKASFAENFKTSTKPYEGHYYHHAIACRDTVIHTVLQPGTLIIPTAQAAKSYLVNTLEPNSNDGFFAWNFFDSVLQQKEWFSDYVFEDIAADLLAGDATLKARFDQAMLEDKTMATDHWQQLYWVYKNSAYYEPTAFRIPVFSIAGGK